MSRREYQRELEELNKEILTMGSMVEEAVWLSVEALATKDMDLARKVAANDVAVDEIGLAIEGRCLNLLALQQPLARDLRLVATAISIATDLERMGDHAVNVSEIVLRIGKTPLIKPLVDIPEMADSAQRMIRGALTRLSVAMWTLRGRRAGTTMQSTALTKRSLTNWWSSQSTAETRG